MSGGCDQIKRDLEKLRNRYKEKGLFRSKNHRYKLNPTLSEKYIVRFEKQHDTQLPSDYRSFLKEVGNGGAGPYYGMYKLEEYYQPRGCEDFRGYPGIEKCTKRR